MAQILLIDDMAGVRRALCAMLKRAGHTVVEPVTAAAPAIAARSSALRPGAGAQADATLAKPFGNADLVRGRRPIAQTRRVTAGPASSPDFRIAVAGRPRFLAQFDLVPDGLDMSRQHSRARGRTMANHPFRDEFGQNGCLQVRAFAAQQRSDRFDQRIVIMTDFPPEDVHRRAPFLLKCSNGGRAMAS
jgi:CheY-like chemotaxis protein